MSTLSPGSEPARNLSEVLTESCGFSYPLGCLVCDPTVAATATAYQAEMEAQEEAEREAQRRAAESQGQGRLA